MLWESVQHEVAHRMETFVVVVFALLELPPASVLWVPLVFDPTVAMFTTHARLPWLYQALLVMYPHAMRGASWIVISLSYAPLLLVMVWIALETWHSGNIRKIALRRMYRHRDAEFASHLRVAL
jgi:hypothetical protein